MRWIRFSLQRPHRLRHPGGRSHREVAGDPFGGYEKTSACTHASTPSRSRCRSSRRRSIASASTMPSTSGRPPPSCGIAADLPKQPDVGYRAVNALIAHEEPVVIPPDASKVQYEGELAVVIGKRAKHLSEADALSCVLGYSIGNDVSERAWQKSDRTLWRAKNTDTFKPMGPWIETDVDLDALETRVRVNGTRDDPLSHQRHAVRRRHLHQHHHAATSRSARRHDLDGHRRHLARPQGGDMVEVEITGIGTLRNPFIAAARKSDARVRHGRPLPCASSTLPAGATVASQNMPHGRRASERGHEDHSRAARRWAPGSRTSIWPSRSRTATSSRSCARSASTACSAFPGSGSRPTRSRASARMFGDLEINVANQFHEPGHPEVMVLSNMTKDGKPVGLGDAGQGWHTDMSYSKDIALANVLYAIKVPMRDGRPLGDTQFRNMHAAYDGSARRHQAPARGPHGHARLRQVLGHDARAAGLAARAADAGAARQEAAGVAADLSHPSDHRPHHPLLQSGLRHAHRRHARGRERRAAGVPVQAPGAGEVSSTPTSGPRATC